jgi:hypothetical protein
MVYGRQRKHTISLKNNIAFSSHSMRVECCPAFFSPPKPCVIRIIEGSGTFVHPSASLQYSYSQRRPLPLDSDTSVEVYISQGTIFHPHAKVLIVLPYIDTTNVIKVAVGMCNLFEEKSTVKIVLTDVVNESTDTTLPVIGNYNVFGPKCSVTGICSIGSCNIFDASCLISVQASHDSAQTATIKVSSPNIHDCCMFAPLVNLEIDPLLDSPTWDHLAVFLLDGQIQFRSYAHKAVGMPSDSKHKELESLCASMRHLMEEKSNT